MAKWNGKEIDSIELTSNPDELPWYAKQLASFIISNVCVHFYSDNKTPRFVTMNYSFEDGHKLIFDEVHIKQFIYQSNILLRL